MLSLKLYKILFYLIVCVFMSSGHSLPVQYRLDIRVIISTISTVIGNVASRTYEKQSHSFHVAASKAVAGLLTLKRSLTRGRVCRLQLPLVLASAVILRSKSLGLMIIFYCRRSETLPTCRARSPYLYPPGTWCPSYISRYRVPFRRLVLLAGLWWRYSKPPPRADCMYVCICMYVGKPWDGPSRKH
jgi:hypothetical protein